MAATAAAAAVPVPPTLIGKGAFGAVVQPVLAFPNTVPDPENAPDNVMKIMFKKKDYNGVVKHLPTVKALLKNAGHRTTPSPVAHKFRNLPSSLQSSIRQVNDFKSAGPDTDIYTLRMPYLGIDVHKLVNEIKEGGKEIRNRSVLFILNQVVKLIGQVNTLVENEYIHGDIRDTNLMVHPFTGTMTLIDFDWLKPKDEFIDKYAREGAFGFYSNPPESLFTGLKGTFTKRGILSSDGGPSPTVVYPKVVSYVDEFYAEFTCCRDIFMTRIPDASVRSDDDIDDLCVNLLGEDIVEANNHNKEFFDEMGITSLKPDVWKTFDGFGLAWTLLTFFNYAYTSGSMIGDMDAFQRDLSTLITNEGVPYTEAQGKACANAIRRMTEEVLASLSDFEYRFRIPTREALAVAISIRDELAALFADGVAAAEAVPEPVPEPVKAVGGAGVVRSTRHRKNRRNHRTRRRRRN